LSPDRDLSAPFGYADPPVKPESSPTASPLSVLWRRQLVGSRLFAFRQAERATPILLDSGLWVASSRVTGVQVLEPESGALKHVLETRGAVETPFVRDPDSGDVFFGDSESFVYRFRPDGTRVWAVESAGPVVSAVGLGAGLVVFHAIDGSLIALDRESGAQRWAYERDMRMSSELELFGSSRPLIQSGLVVTGFSDGSVVALRASDGTVAWEKRLIADGLWLDVDGDPLLINDNQLVISALSGPTVSLRLDTGAEVWRYQGGTVSRPLLHEGRLYLPTPEHELVALDAATGTRVWNFALPKKSNANEPLFWRGQLLVTTDRGELYVLEPGTGKQVYQLVTDPRINGFSAAPLGGPSLLFVVSEGGYVYALAPQDFQQAPVRTEADRWQFPRSDALTATLPPR
jgi:outer membrane protein assembly factor BamB